MTNANIPLNLPQRYKKGIMTTFMVSVAPFYRCNTVAKEGAPVVLDSANPGFVKPATANDTAIFGLLAQEVYDASALGELAGYEFHNNTKARKGDTVGVIIGQGYVQTINYTGTIVAGDKLYVGANGVLTKIQSAGGAVVGIAEDGGTDGADYIRVRVNFNFPDVSATTDSSNSAE